MRCDDVFDILTSRPFPGGTPSDDAVERHLASCHECRRFAEALRPISTSGPKALGLQYEGKFGDKANEVTSVDLVNRVQTLVSREHESRLNQKQSRRVANRSWVKFAVVCAAACLLGAAATLGGPLLVKQVVPAKSIHLGATPSMHLGVGEGQCGSSLLACIKTNAVIPVNMKASADACCLKCHGGIASGREKRNDAIALVVMSCQKCHQESSDLVRL